MYKDLIKCLEDVGYSLNNPSYKSNNHVANILKILKTKKEITQSIISEIDDQEFKKSSDAYDALHFELAKITDPPKNYKNTRIHIDNNLIPAIKKIMKDLHN